MINLVFWRALRIAGAVLLIEAWFEAPVAANQDGSVGGEKERQSVVGSSLDVPLTDDIIVKVLRHNNLRDAHLEQYSVVRTYEVRDLKGKLSAQAVVRMEYHLNPA